MYFFFFKQKTAYEMRISDWSSDVCSSDLSPDTPVGRAYAPDARTTKIAAGRRTSAIKSRRGRSPDLRSRRRHSPIFKPSGATVPKSTPYTPRAAHAPTPHHPQPAARRTTDRQSAVYGKTASVSVDSGGRPTTKNKTTPSTPRTPT